MVTLTVILTSCTVGEIRTAFLIGLCVSLSVYNTYVHTYTTYLPPSSSSSFLLPVCTHYESRQFLLS